MLQTPFLRVQEISNDGDRLLLRDLEDGKHFQLLTSPIASSLLHDGDADAGSGAEWLSQIEKNIETLLGGSSRGSSRRMSLLLVGCAALDAFLQSNATGPSLAWKPAEICLPQRFHHDPVLLSNCREQLISSLTTDGEAAYRLIPHVELFCLAMTLLNHGLLIADADDAVWARLRVNFWHQRMLEENAVGLHDLIYKDLHALEHIVLAKGSRYSHQEQTQFLLERAAIHIFHGLDVKARQDLDLAARKTGFKYVLTGRLGKRTKYQQFEISQLVVLARSADGEQRQDGAINDGGLVVGRHEAKHTQSDPEVRPVNLELNDDTLLEAISFAQISSHALPKVEENLPSELVNLDPANQAVLNPLDSIILLLLASSITNTSPQHGLTREETLPYATRVLEGGSTNWQIYTQALLVRSRIEGYRSRTVERGVLQLQALVDQVIAETTGGHPRDSPGGTAADNPSTFLPRPRPSESAPVSERLQYIHQLASPTRWSLEAELAARWVSLGGLRTALEIYERLEMWAEVALCWASLENEDKARSVVQRQLYRSPDDPSTERTPLPNDAPRLFCILGDLEKSPALYERAWTVSNERYARAQRSLGKYYLASQELKMADAAYSKSLAINPQHASTWFALGCVRLELQDWKGAVEAFGRTVKVEDEDAEAWSNLAAALLRLAPDVEVPPQAGGLEEDELEAEPKADAQRHVKGAHVALKRAAGLKRDSYRIWQNLLNVSVTMSPPPYSDIIIAQQRIIDLRGSVEGEGCVDVEVMEGLLAHVIANTPERSPAKRVDGLDGEEPRRHGLEAMFTDLVQKQIVPLITHSRRLWKLVAKLSIHLNRPSAALDAYEKAWRVTLNKPGWDDGSGLVSSSTTVDANTPDKVWQAVVDSTVELVDAYESLGEREVTEGLAAGSGQLIAPNWKYKSRMAIRSVVGRRTKAGLEGIEPLQARMETLKTG